MTINVTTASGEDVKVRVVKGKAVADTDALRKYHREYYRLNKQDCERERCKTKFTSQIALVRHQRRNQKCALLRARKSWRCFATGRPNKCQRQLYKCRQLLNPLPLGLRLPSSTSTSSTSSIRWGAATSTVARRRMRSACHQPALLSQARFVISITFEN